MACKIITKRFPRKGKALSRWRKAHRIPLHDFAFYAEVSWKTITNYEKGRPIKPSMVELIEYAKKRLIAHPEELEALQSKKDHWRWEEEI